MYVTTVIIPGGLSEIWHGGEQTLGPAVLLEKGHSAFYRKYAYASYREIETYVFLYHLHPA